jgi:hypothetical protein
MFLVTRPLALSNIELLNWASHLERRVAGATAEHADETS